MLNFFAPTPPGFGEEILIRSVIPALLVWAVGLLIHLPAWHKHNEREQTLPVITGRRWYSPRAAEPADSVPRRAQESAVVQREAA